MSNYENHAKKEFEVLGWPGDDEMQKLMCEQIIELLILFGKHGHSGSSAPYAVNLFKKLALFHPISPLTGCDSEWNEIGDNLFQNNRCSHVFKKDGKAYDIDGKVFSDDDGETWFTSGESRVYITFPYTPKTEYIKIKQK